MIIYLEIEVEKVDGKFVSRDSVAEAAAAELEGVTLDVEESQYEVGSVSVYYPPKVNVKQPKTEKK